MPKKQNVAQELAAMCDRMYEKREERLALNRQAASLEEEEKAMKAVILDLMISNDLSAVGGHLCRVTRDKVAKATVGDWSKFYEFIIDNSAFDCLQRRLNDKAIKERLEVDKDPIPGIVQIWVPVLSVSKV